MPLATEPRYTLTCEMPTFGAPAAAIPAVRVEPDASSAAECHHTAGRQVRRYIFCGTRRI